MRKTGLLLPFQISRITVFGRDAKKKKRRGERKTLKVNLSLEKAFSE